MKLLAGIGIGSSQRKAFALTETLVGIAILGVTFVSLYTGVSSGFALAQLARENLRATQIIQEKLETIRLYTWEQITTPGFIPTGFTENFYATSTNITSGLIYTGTVVMVQAPAGWGVPESYLADLKQVTVTLQWRSGRVLRTRQMQTFVGKNGLQSYIY